MSKAEEKGLFFELLRELTVFENKKKIVNFKIQTFLPLHARSLRT